MDSVNLEVLRRVAGWIDAGVCIEAHDRAALVYPCAKQQSEPSSYKRVARMDGLHLTSLELIDRIAALVPPSRMHRHRTMRSTDKSIGERSRRRL